MEGACQRFGSIKRRRGRPCRALDGESASPKEVRDGLLVGSDQRRRKGVCAGLDEEAGVGGWKRAGYPLMV